MLTMKGLSHLKHASVRMISHSPPLHPPHSTHGVNEFPAAFFKLVSRSPVFFLNCIFPLRPELYSFLTRPEHWAHWLHKEFSHLHEVVPPTRVDVLNAIGPEKVELVNCSESQVA